MLEAIVLAGGLGTRLKSVVPNIPKSLAQINGVPFLKILLSSLEKKGCSRVVLALGFGAEMVVEFLATNSFDFDVEYVVESEPLGTGGGARLASEKCQGENVLILNGDTYIEYDQILLSKFWYEKKGVVIVAKHVSNASRYGTLEIDQEKIKAYSEKTLTKSGFINAGCCLLEIDMLRRFHVGQPFSLEDDFFTHEVKTGNVHAFITDGKFIDIGTPDDYERAQSFFCSDKISTSIGNILI